MSEIDNRFEKYLQSDLAAKYGKTLSSAAAAFAEQDLAPYLSALDRDGYVILENLIDAEAVATLRSAV